MAATSILTQGGPVMYVILALSVFAVAIAFAKVWQFYRAGFRRCSSTVERGIELALAGKLSEARRTLDGCSSPVARVSGLTLRLMAGDGVDASTASVEIQRVGTAEIRALESWLRGLTAIAHLSPLLGLLGTIFGMIEAFQQIEQAGKHVSPALLAGGIWEALLTTAFGLAVAIPATGAFFLLEGEIDNIRAAMKDAVARLTTHFDKVAPDNDKDIPKLRVAGEGYGV
ncbi:MAG: MotA/TolQ/ExbB proton channel family protein [Candidatus Binatia bacterium]